MTPAAWTTMRLGDVCTKVGSGATPRGGSGVYPRTGPYALIRSQNVHNDGFHHDGLAFIDEKHAAELDNVDVLEGDVLLNITGDSVARVCQVDSGVLPARVNQHVAIIRPEPSQLSPRFLRYVLVSPEMQTKLKSWASSGGTRNALTKGMIESLPMLAPRDVAEQRAIADVLGALDDKIELNRRMNQTLVMMMRALFTSWFLDFDPVRAKVEGRSPDLPKPIADLFPVRIATTAFGETPEGWRTCNLSEACTAIYSGGTPSTIEPGNWGGNIPWLSSGETRSKFIVTTDQRITREGVSNSSTRLAKSGATVIASAGQGRTRGQTSLLLVDSYINQSVIALNADPQRISSAFLFFDLERRYGQFRQLSDGHSSRGSLTTRLLAALPFVVPPLALIQAFDHVSAPAVDRIKAALVESQTLAALRETLLPKVISGEIRVSQAEQMLEAVPG